LRRPVAGVTVPAMCYDLEPDALRPTRQDSPGPAPRIAQSVLCRGCGYELFGLPMDGVCPECGTPAARSMGPDLLIYSAPDFVEKLHRGVLIVLTTLIVSILLVLVGLATGFVVSAGQQLFTGMAYLLGIVGVANSAAMAWGWWLTSSPDPASREGMRGEKARKLVRILTVVGLTLTILAQFASIILPFVMSAVPQIPQQPQPAPGGAPPAMTPALLAMAGVSMLIGLIKFVAWAGLYFAQMYYIRWLSPRLPDQWVFDRAKLLMWLGPLLYTVGAFCLMIGPLVALVLYWNLLDRVRKDLKQIRIDQQSDVLSGGGV